jgi:hypothetical protein
VFNIVNCGVAIFLGDCWVSSNRCELEGDCGFESNFGTTGICLEGDCGFETNFGTGICLEGICLEGDCGFETNFGTTGICWEGICLEGDCGFEINFGTGICLEGICLEGICLEGICLEGDCGLQTNFGTIGVCLEDDRDRVLEDILSITGICSLQGISALKGDCELSSASAICSEDESGIFWGLLVFMLSRWSIFEYYFKTLFNNFNFVLDVQFYGK